MPYIPKWARDRLKDVTPNDVGDLNYLITEMCVRYLNHKGVEYRTYNDIIGVLECSKLELYRRKIADYEDKKKKENGDVYE